MRLVDAETLELVDFAGKTKPPYAILSHTWEGDEVTLQEYRDRRDDIRLKPGYLKIAKTCELARKDGLRYVWCDTCCIDKTSSAELSEAINSMFSWYEKSDKCYAYLADVDSSTIPTKNSRFVNSRWFTRGWTLQELLAPREVMFYSSDWVFISTRSSLCEIITYITMIPQNYLRRENPYQIQYFLQNASIAERMSWASNRETTREEDAAYSLLGIFAINMPLLYGEGRRAFQRLQEELISKSDDQTVLAWQSLHDLEPYRFHTTFLASSTREFAESGDLLPYPVGRRSSTFSITNKGLEISVPLFVDENGETHALLECYQKTDPMSMVVLRLYHIEANVYARWGSQPGRVNYRAASHWKRSTICVVTDPGTFFKNRSKPSDRPEFLIHTLPKGFSFSGVSPGYASNMFPVPWRQAGQTLVHEAGHLTSTKDEDMAPIKISLVARQLHHKGGRSRRYWMSCRLSQNAPNSPAAAQPYLTLADGNVLFASTRHDNVFGRRLLIYDFWVCRPGMVQFMTKIMRGSFHEMNRIIDSHLHAQSPAPVVSEANFWHAVIYVLDLGFSDWLSMYSQSYGIYRTLIGFYGSETKDDICDMASREANLSPTLFDIWDQLLLVLFAAILCLPILLYHFPRAIFWHFAYKPRYPDFGMEATPARRTLRYFYRSLRTHNRDFAFPSMMMVLIIVLLAFMRSDLQCSSVGFWDYMRGIVASDKAA
jgi:hypothetical protein